MSYSTENNVVFDSVCKNCFSLKIEHVQSKVISVKGTGDPTNTMDIFVRPTIRDSKLRDVLKSIETVLWRFGNSSVLAGMATFYIISLSHGFQQYNYSWRSLVVKWRNYC